MSQTSPPGRRFFSPVFLVCALVLLVAAVGLHPALGALVSYYSKLPIELRQSLDDFDHYKLSEYRRLPDNPQFEQLFENQDLGTDDWLGIWFRARGEDPSATPMMLFVTYYSDPHDTIPHTPEVCYRQSGSVINGTEAITVPTPGLGPDLPEVDALLVDIDGGPRHLAVVYVIVVNGAMYNGRERARIALGIPGDKHTYFSKVEVAVPCGDASFEDTVARAVKLLGDSLPVLMDDHFPTREQVSRRD
ncbi:MAG: exosortase-associated EpsI family protein [Planctomycetota bacterium]|jgi:hypothetical protein